MTTSNTETFEIGNEIVEVADSFILSGSLIHKDGKSDNKVMRRIMMGNDAAMGRMDKIL